MRRVTQSGNHDDGMRVATPRIRRRPVPSRELIDLTIVARPADGTPVVLAPTAATVWKALEDWITTDEIDRRLEAAFPDVSEFDRHSARQQVLITLEEEGLVEQR